MDEEEAIVEALGEESAYGYHIEPAPKPYAIVPVRDRPAARWYPCLDTGCLYTGCLGEECPLQVCWTGKPSISYIAALRHRFQPIAADYTPGARCLECRHVQEVSLPVLDQQRGLIHLPMLHCDQDRWQHPISAPAFVRRRIPAMAHTDLVFCGRFEPVEQPIPAVEGHRLRTNQLARDRRAHSE
jgi:hypothetical protein